MKIDFTNTLSLARFAYASPRTRSQRPNIFLSCAPQPEQRCDGASSDPMWKTHSIHSIHTSTYISQHSVFLLNSNIVREKFGERQRERAKERERSRRTVFPNISVAAAASTAQPSAAHSRAAAANRHIASLRRDAREHTSSRVVSSCVHRRAESRRAIFGHCRALSTTICAGFFLWIGVCTRCVEQSACVGCVFCVCFVLLLVRDGCVWNCVCLCVCMCVRTHAHRYRKLWFREHKTHTFTIIVVFPACSHNTKPSAHQRSDNAA